jgi:HK97 family phage portal protein
LAIKEFFDSIFPSRKVGRYLRILDGRTPVFSQFGTNIYFSDIVQNCIDRTATECSKLQLQHIRIDNKTRQQEIVNGSFNRLFKFAPNPLMTTADFIEKIVWLLYLNYNVFIYPVYDVKYDRDGQQYKEYKAFYPLNPKQVTFMQDEQNKIFLEFIFASGDKYTLSYTDVIHIRKKYSMSDIMGGGLNGQPDNTPLLKRLETNDIVIQGIAKAIKTSLSIKLVANIKTMFDTPEMRAERKRFEDELERGNTAILAADLKSDITPINIDPKLIDDATLKSIEGGILRWFGMSFPILSGDYSEDQYQAWFEQSIEPFMNKLGQAFSMTILTQRQQDYGNEIRAYHNRLEYLTIKSKNEIVKIAGEQGLLTRDQKLAIYGFPPIGGDDGAVIDKSLNFINIKIADQYQLQSLKKQKEVTTNNDKN